jgi:hypothetical protein
VAFQKERERASEREREREFQRERDIGTEREGESPRSCPSKKEQKKPNACMACVSVTDRVGASACSRAVCRARQHILDQSDAMVCQSL